MEGGEEIERFEITKFDYRNIFDKSLNQNVSHTKIIFKFFNFLKKSLTSIRFFESLMEILTIIKTNGKNYLYYSVLFVLCRYRKWIFKDGSDGNLLNPDNPHSTFTSEVTYNCLIGTFSDIGFESFKEKIPEARFAANLQTILKTDIMSKSFEKIRETML